MTDTARRPAVDRLLTALRGAVGEPPAAPFGSGDGHREPPADDRTAAIVLVTATALLLVFEYWGRPGFYVSSGLGGWVARVDQGRFADLADAAGYLWWGLSSMLWRVLVPLALGVWVLRMRPADLGYRLRGIARHLPPYGIAYLVMLPLLILVSGFESFGTYYPFYERAVEGGAGLWVYWAGYAMQFVGVEAFFRGYLTFGLAPRFGWLAVPIMTVPYTMIHFAKPMPEAISAIAAGLALGTLALRSRSWVPGVFLHVAVAITLDVLVMLRAGALPF